MHGIHNDDYDHYDEKTLQKFRPQKLKKIIN